MQHPERFVLKKTAIVQSEILSVGTYLPSQVVRSDDLFEEFKSEQRYGIPIDYMSKTMGIQERRMTVSGTQPSKLAIVAAERALESCPDVARKDIDLVLFCGIERDQPEPATAHSVQYALGTQACNVFDVANACLGFVDGLKIANSYIATGLARYALVTTGEISSRITRSIVNQLQIGVDLQRAQLMLGALSVGDAGGAVLLAPSFDAGFELFNSNVDSSHVEKCIYFVKDDGEIGGQMQMGQVLAHGIKMHRRSIHHTLRRLGWDEFDWVLSHQTGKRNFDAFSRMPGVNQSRMIRTYEKLGNTTTATFPLSWEKLMLKKELRAGDKIGGLFAGSGLSTCQFGLTY